MERMQVTSKVCNQCLLSSARIVSAERVEDILDTCNETHQFFECHKTKGVCCRAFFNGNYSMSVRLAKMCKAFDYVEVTP